MLPTDEIEIRKLIHKMKNTSSKGHDGISNVLLKGIKEGISIPLSIVFNKSLQEGIMQSKLKIADIKPLYKSRSKFVFNNYRPVSLLSCISKVLEKIVCKRLTSFLENNNIIYEPNIGTWFPVLKEESYISGWP